MEYRAELADRAIRNLRRIYRNMDAANSMQACDWFNRLETAIFNLAKHPARSPVTPENSDLRHLLYGSTRYVYRVIYTIDERQRLVTVLHICHGSRQPLSPR